MAAPCKSPSSTDHRAIDIDGIAIPAGEIMIAGLLAANRDSRYTAQPDTLDSTRTDTPPLAFGQGIHTAWTPHWPGWKPESR